MVLPPDGRPAATPEVDLGPDFTERLERSLRAADQERKRRLVLRRLRPLLPILLLVGPIVGWHLTQASPGGVHVVIHSLAWLTFLLAVGVQVDTSVLSYLGLQSLPSIVGVALLVLITGWLLSSPRGER